MPMVQCFDDAVQTHLQKNCENNPYRNNHSSYHLDLTDEAYKDAYKRPRPIRQTFPLQVT